MSRFKKTKVTFWSEKVILFAPQNMLFHMLLGVMLFFGPNIARNMSKHVLKSQLFTKKTTFWSEKVNCLVRKSHCFWVQKYLCCCCSCSCTAPASSPWTAGWRAASGSAAPGSSARALRSPRGKEGPPARRGRGECYRCLPSVRTLIRPWPARSSPQPHSM